jgi:hypothetical protein
MLYIILLEKSREGNARTLVQLCIAKAKIPGASALSRDLVLSLLCAKREAILHADSASVSQKIKL